MINNRWGGILQSRDTSGLSAELRKSLINRLSCEDSAGALKLLYGIRETLQSEIFTGRRIPEEIQKLIEALPNITFADDLKSSLDRFLGLAAELYTVHSSVSSTFSLAQSFYDTLVEVAFYHCFALLESEGRVDPCLRFSVLVSGELGRIESVNGSRSSFFLIYRDGKNADSDYVNEFAMRFMAVLRGCFPGLSRNFSSTAFFWFGSNTQWLEFTEKTLLADATESSDSDGSRFSTLIEILADMRIVCGDPVFGQELVDYGRKMLGSILDGGMFWPLAKEISSMPVALGIFGRIKTVRSGKNRGKVDLKGMAIDPLAAAARVLSLSSKTEETSFTGRINVILAAGNVGVALADRLLIAYQEFMRERIKLELFGAKGEEGLFFNPEELDEESHDRFKNGLDDITTLQRLVHQHLVEVEQG
ncbi:MAG: hypothetical protein HXX17_16190 [Geobacteraceae bacterium]|nr:hypothetical protein [Geobacteraceae bacterium]